MTDESHGTQDESVRLHWSCGITGLQLALSIALAFGYRSTHRAEGHAE